MQIIKVAVILAVLLASILGIAFVVDAITEQQATEFAVKGAIVLSILAASGFIMGLISRPSHGNDLPPPSEPMK